MGKKSRERREKKILNNIQKHSRVFDFALRTSRDVDNCVPIDLTDAKIPDDTFLKDFSVMSFAKNITPIFPKVFFEIHDFNYLAWDSEEKREMGICTCDLGVLIQFQENTELNELSDDRFMGEAFFWMVNDGGVKYCDVGYRFWVTLEGKFSGAMWTAARAGRTLEESVDDTVEFIILKAMSAIFHGLSLIHCHNIELIDHEPNPTISQQYQQHFGQPLTTYKTLAIKPIGKRYESAPDPKDYQGLMPLHLRRGNFAHYTEDAPLFGKYAGTFWRPATAVGEAKNGTVIKDYKVIAE